MTERDAETVVFVVEFLAVVGLIVFVVATIAMMQRRWPSLFARTNKGTSMKRSVFQAVILLAIGAAIGCLLGGRYELYSHGDALYRINRMTGAT